jgi:hypothetical protein
MAGRTPHRAVTAFVEPIQAALSCFVVGGKVTVSSREIGRPGVLTFNDGRPTALTGPARPRITCSMGYEIVKTEDETKPFKVHTVKYMYRLTGRRLRLSTTTGTQMISPISRFASARDRVWMQTASSDGPRIDRRPPHIGGGVWGFAPEQAEMGSDSGAQPCQLRFGRHMGNIAPERGRGLTEGRQAMRRGRVA